MEASGRVKKGELTKTQLIAILKQRGERGYSRLTRPQLLQRVGDQEDIPLAQLRRQRREQGPGFSPVVQAPVQRVEENIPLVLLQRPQGPGFSPAVQAPAVQAPAVREPGYSREQALAQSYEQARALGRLLEEDRNRRRDQLREIEANKSSKEKRKEQRKEG